jgi:hypothetical protein
MKLMLVRLWYVLTGSSFLGHPKLEFPGVMAQGDAGTTEPENIFERAACENLIFAISLCLCRTFVEEALRWN